MIAALVLAAAAAAPIDLDLRRPPVDPNGIVVASVVSGGEPLEWAGSRLAGGDVNGDGIADLVIAAPGGTDDRPSRRGRIYVVFGRVTPPRPRIDLTLKRAASAPGAPPAFISGADVVIEGAGDFDHLGRAMAVIDLDGDGFADIVAGAPRADGPGDARSDCGEVHVVFGAATLPGILRLDSASPVVASNTAPASPRTAVIHGRAPGDAFGSAIAAGDLTGDGVIDLLVGAPLADSGAGVAGAPADRSGLDVGEAVIVPAAGRLPSGRGALDLADGAAASSAVFLRGADAGDQAGGALAVGDFDGDTADDIAVGARGGDGTGNHRPDSGEVYMVFGAGAPPASLALGTGSDVFIAGADIGDLAGGSLAMGDTNGDGRADLLIGAEFADGRRNGHLDAGEVILLAGRTRAELEALRPPPEKKPGSGPLPRPAGGTQQEPLPPGPVPIDPGGRAPAGWTAISGLDPGDHTGVLGTVDLDGDGLKEILIGAGDAAGRRNSRAGAGEAAIVTGRRNFPAGLSVDSEAAVSISGPVGGVHLGTAAAAVDLDGDGRDELVVSAPQAGQALAGMVYILKGRWEDLLRPRSPKGGAAAP